MTELVRSLIHTDLDDWSQPDVRRRYEQFMVDHHGELDVAALCETMTNFGARRAITAMSVLDDLVPRLRGLEDRIAQMADVVAGLTGLDD